LPKKQIIIPAAIGHSNANLSPATKFGNLVFVAGQTGRNPVTNEVGADIREQTRNVLERIKIILEDAGSSLDNVLTATCWLTDVANGPAFNEEYAKYFTADKPARATVEAKLMGPDLLVEIMVTACIPD
jgi:reactive intermediate/imine deaminase